MRTLTDFIAVKVPAEMAKALRNAEAKTGVNRSELLRDAIAIGLRPAITSRMDAAKKHRALLAISK